MKKLLFLFIATTIFYACPLINPNPPDGCSLYGYTFDISVLFEPTDSIIHIGDTVTITSTFPNKLKSFETNELFLFDSIDFKTGSHFIRFDTLLERNKHYHFVDDFVFIFDSIYNLRKGDNVIAFDYYYSDGKYFLQYKFIPNNKGVYLFEFISRLNLIKNNDVQKIINEKTGCIPSVWYPRFQTNNGNNYKELLKQSPNDGYNTKVYDDWSKYNLVKGAHCFKVVD